MGPGNPERAAVFLDRDNTLMHDVPYCSRPDQVRLMPGVGGALRDLRGLGFLLIVITNQSGIARGYFTQEQAEAVHGELRKQLSQWDATIDALYYCPHLPSDDCRCRKPGTLLFERACQEYGIDPRKSYVVGDRAKDMEAGLRMGCGTVLMRNNVGLAEVLRAGLKPTVTCSDLQDFVNWLSIQGESDGLGGRELDAKSGHPASGGNLPR